MPHATSSEQSKPVGPGRRQYLDPRAISELKGITPYTVRVQLRSGCYRGAKGGQKRGERWRVPITAFANQHPEIPLDEIRAAANS